MNTILSETANYLIDRCRGSGCDIFLRDSDLEKLVLRWPVDSSAIYGVPTFNSRQEVEDRYYIGTRTLWFELRGEGVDGFCFVTNPENEVSQDDVAPFLQEQALKVEEARKLRSAERPTKYVPLLGEIDIVIRSAKNPVEALTQAAEIARGEAQEERGFNCEMMLVFLRDSERPNWFKCVALSPPDNELKTIASFEKDAPRVFTSKFSSDENVINVKEASYPPPLLGESIDSVLFRHLESGKLRCYIAAKVITARRLLGYILLINKKASEPGHRTWFTNDDKTIIRVLSEKMATVIESWQEDQVSRRMMDSLLRMVSLIHNFRLPEDFGQALIAASAKNRNALERLQELSEIDSQSKAELNHVLNDVRDSAAMLRLLQDMYNRSQRGGGAMLHEKMGANKLFYEVRDFVHNSGMFRDVHLIIKPSPVQISAESEASLMVALLACVKILSEFIILPPAIALESAKSSSSVMAEITCILQDGGKHKTPLESICKGEKPQSQDMEYLRATWKAIVGLSEGSGSTFRIDLSDDKTGMVLFLKE